ncbi:hypothetical protein [Burkholderia contaminans]|uniref:hypothetical protein n=1 Tax=Burkholderia contaminans TaxID=488447 RepID=UPI001F13370B|nr:hypothetical protein [Burkholderia contaminans]UMY33547.1 hypothetical protein MMB18_38320 [Burkholderia contaminans]
MERKSPFDLAGFEPRQPKGTDTRPSPDEVDQIAAATGFPSRAPAPVTTARVEGRKPRPTETNPRAPKAEATVTPTAAAAAAAAESAESQTATDNRRRTGRNIQKNFKLTAQNIVDLEFEAKKAGITFGEVVERGIAAIRKLRELEINDY